MPRLNKNSHIPLYQQLVQTLVARIDSGDLSPSDRIPSERELAENMDVSRTTARLAIEELVSSGLVYREQGRGTYVAEPRMRSLMGFASFTEDMLSRGCQPTSRVLKQELIDPDLKLQNTLHCASDEKVLHLVRLRMADDEPVALQSTNIPHRLAPGLEKADLQNKSLFKILREQYYIHPAWTEAEMEAMAATTEQADLFQIDTGDPVLVVRGLTFTDSFEIVEAVETVYRGRGLALYIGRQRISAPKEILTF